jgi:hypothetical protein
MRDDLADSIDQPSTAGSWHGHDLTGSISSDYCDSEYEPERQRVCVDMDHVEPRGSNRRLDRSRPRHQRVTSGFDLRDSYDGQCELGGRLVRHAYCISGSTLPRTERHTDSIGRHDSRRRRDAVPDSRCSARGAKPERNPLDAGFPCYGEDRLLDRSHDRRRPRRHGRHSDRRTLDLTVPPRVESDGTRALARSTRERELGRSADFYFRASARKHKTRGPVGSAGFAASRNWHAYIASELNSKAPSPASQVSGEGVPEAGFEPARRCRHKLAMNARLPVPPFGHVRENGESEKRSSQVTSRSPDSMVAPNRRNAVINRLRASSNHLSSNSTPRSRRCSHA